MTATTGESGLVGRRTLLAGLVGSAALAAVPLAGLAALDETADANATPQYAPGGAAGELSGELAGLYQHSADQWCPGLPWPVLAAIGSVESDHTPTAIGPPLDGGDGVQAIAATHEGTAWHGDGEWERAVGMMQFLPQTFLAYGVAVDDGRQPDPFHPGDATAAAARYLCAHGANEPGRLEDALYAYNHADWYVDEVMAKAGEYAAAGQPQLASASLSGGTVAPDYVAVALAQLGKPYQWGAEGPDAFDCSGLVRYALERVGVAIPRVSRDQAAHVAAYGTQLPVETAAGVYGALVFRIGVSAVDHVVISTGDGRTVEARTSSEPVQRNQLAGRQWTSAGLIPQLDYDVDTSRNGRRRVM